MFLVPILKAFDKREDAFYEQLFLEICEQRQAGCVVASLFATFPPICHFWQKWEKWRNRKYTFHLEVKELQLVTNFCSNMARIKALAFYLQTLKKKKEVKLKLETKYSAYVL